MTTKAKAETKNQIGIVPLNDRIILRQEDKETKIGRIFLPDGSQEAPARGTVLAVGRGTRLQDGTLAAPSVKPGDQVVFAKWAGDKIEHDGEELLMLREADVMAVIEPE